MPLDPEHIRIQDAAEAHLVRLEGRIDELRDSLTGVLERIYSTLAMQEKNLAEHMARTEALERLVAVIQSETKPIQHHVVLVGAIAKVCAAAGALMGLLLGAYQLFRAFS